MQIESHKVFIEHDPKGTSWLVVGGVGYGVHIQKIRITAEELAGLVAELSREFKAWQAREAANPYQVLAVPPDASDKVIKQAFRKQMHIHHPDKGGSQEKAKAINAAYELLSDVERRKAYDQTLTH